jgi:hypothetical protein
MQFFLLDFALAFVALLGYRALAAVALDRGPAVLLEGRSHPEPARTDITRPGRRVEPEAVAAARALHGDPSCCEGLDDRMTCGERPPHRLINFW